MNPFDISWQAYVIVAAACVYLTQGFLSYAQRRGEEVGSDYRTVAVVFALLWMPVLCMAAAVGAFWCVWKFWELPFVLLARAHERAEEREMAEERARTRALEDHEDEIESSIRH